ncbi:MAG: hypothetical protein NTW48_04110 [Chloroflexi bacterium]|nr:hypothetical protein [Chloroflexota bacterium]
MERKNPEGIKLIIFKLCCDGVREPNEDEIEAAKKKFLDEHPGHHGPIVLNFLHLDDGEQKKHGEEDSHN